MARQRRRYTCSGCGAPGMRVDRCRKCAPRRPKHAKAPSAIPEPVMGPVRWTLSRVGDEVIELGRFDTLEEAKIRADEDHLLEWRDPDASYDGYTAGARGGQYLIKQEAGRATGMYKKMPPQELATT